MIRIRNISKGRPNEARVATRTNWGAGTAAFPILVDLAPGAQLDIPALALSQWDPGVKQWLAEYVAGGLIKVYTLASKHLYQDKGHNAVYGLDYLIDAKLGPLALDHAIAMATTLNAEVQLHFDSDAVHGGNVGAITAAVPTNLTTLQTWIGDAQTEYTTHIASVVAHTSADTHNVLTPVGAVSLSTSIAALRELHRAYHSHKTWVDTAVEMNVSTLLAYC
ncbi:hypothetical protein LCGC14_0723950 [marine sediment metagenome]|uniref:Uncharacterized protein n=1 Tax=marine sediment metagenome TaxID=412755 RepID=A0A0F9QFS5_9ZZZZ